MGDESWHLMHPASLGSGLHDADPVPILQPGEGGETGLAGRVHHTQTDLVADHRYWLAAHLQYRTQELC